MNPVGRILCLIGILCASSAHAQIGRSPNQCVARWGTPISGQVDTNGYGSLSFSAKEVSLAFEFVSGAAQRVVCRAPAWNEALVKRLLGENRDKAAWEPLVLPGRRSAPSGNRKWMRSDEMAMAELSADRLTIVGGGWYRHLAASAAARHGEADPQPREPLPKAIPVRAPAVTDRIVGLWQHDTPDEVMIVLQMGRKGKLTWVEFGKKERREWGGEWDAHAKARPRIYALTESRPQAGVPLRLIGSVQLPSCDLLRFRRDDSFVAAPSGSGGLEPAAQMDFKRVAALPSWKPDGPADMPAMGDSREVVLELLGKPMGKMRTHRREMLLYPWGEVWIVKGVVGKIIK
jgi:hypothetical protein